MSEVPCNGCEERQVGCHAKCQKYMEYRENRIQNHRKVVSEKIKVSTNRQYMFDQMRKNKKRGGKKVGW